MSTEGSGSIFSLRMSKFNDVECFFKSKFLLGRTGLLSEQPKEPGNESSAINQRLFASWRTFQVMLKVGSLSLVFLCENS